MKKMLLMSIFCLVIFLSQVNAQKNSSYNSPDYTTSLGVKFYPTGVTFKHFIANEKALEFIGFFYAAGTRIAGLYEIHKPLLNIEGLKWYYGPGAHIALYNNHHGGFTSVGIDGVIGLDYKINNAPINLSLDYQPSIQLTDFYGDRFTSWGGVAIRYTF